MEMEGYCGPQRNADGNTPVTFRAGNQGEIVTGEMSGKHFEQALRGKLVTYHIASQALLLPATTGGHPTVINPAGSGVLFVPLSLKLGFTSGTTTIGSVLLAETLNALIGTGGTIPTAALVDAKSAYRGWGYKSALLWSPTTNTFTAAPTVLEATGLNLGAAAPTGTGTYETKFDGTTIFGPGTACSVVYSVTTSTALFHITLKGLEIPLPLAA
jgi:hypothetical protein